MDLNFAGNETFEKLGTIGTSANLLVYMTSIFHMESAAATTLLNVFNGTTNLAPIFGAFLSDTYLGRYWTLGFASISSLMVHTAILSYLVFTDGRHAIMFLWIVLVLLELYARRVC